MARNLFIAEARAHELQNFLLALGQPGLRGTIPLPSESSDIAQDQMGHTAGSGRLVIVNHLDGAHEIGQRLSAENICVHSRLNVTNNVAIANLRSQKHDLGAWKLCPSTTYGLKNGFRFA